MEVVYIPPQHLIIIGVLSSRYDLKSIEAINKAIKQALVLENIPGSVITRQIEFGEGFEAEPDLLVEMSLERTLAELWENQRLAIESFVEEVLWIQDCDIACLNINSL